VVGFLNSDDFYANNDVVQKVAEAFLTKETDAVYGDLDYVSLQNKQKVVRRWRSGAYKQKLFYKGWMPPHPTFFVRREVYSNCGGFNTMLKSAADYELMLRLALVCKVNIVYLNDVLVKMRLGGQSNRSLMNRFKANMEDRKAWDINGLRPRWYTLLLKPIQKIPQYFTTQ
jgi:glycosyltransferase